MLKNKKPEGSVMPSVSDWTGYQRYENYKAMFESQDFTGLMRMIEGQMLTIADASFNDLEQRKAVKSLIKNNLWNNTYEEIQKCVFQRSMGKQYPLG